MVFWQIIPVLNTYKKRKKIQKNDFWGLTRPKLCENGPEIVEIKKYTVAHSIPDVEPRNKKKSSISPGYYMRGLPVYQFICKKNNFSFL
jgi:hypothetical protein